MSEFLEWAQSEIAKWWWALISGIAVFVVSSAALAYRVWAWLHARVVTAPQTAGDKATLDEAEKRDNSLRALIIQHQAEADVIRAQNTHKFTSLEESNEDIRRDVERLRAEMSADAVAVRSDIRIVRDRTDEHAKLLAAQGQKVDSIHDMVAFLHDQWGKDNGARRRKNDSES